jgi:hypothetical protein
MDEFDRERELHLWSAKKWSFVTPPMRPSAAELAFYEKALLEASLPEGASALILGATPELRSLALKHRLRTTGCDIDAGFWHAMTLLRTVGGEEEFIHGNWLDIPGESRFDVILGDCSLMMLSWEDCRALVPKLWALLKDGGVSIQRLLTANEALTLDDIGPAMEAYRKDGQRLALNLYLIFLVESLRNLYRPEMTNREFFESAVFPHLTPAEIELQRPFIIERKFTYPQRTDLEALLERHFTVVRTEESFGPGIWGVAWMSVLKKK